MSDTTVFVCNRGREAAVVKVQLEIPEATLQAYKEKAKTTQFTPKQLMENMLKNWVEGVSAT